MSSNEIILQPLSLQVLNFLYDKGEMQSSEVANVLGLRPRQVDACITKTLVRRNFVKREVRFTRLMKKGYNVVFITDDGKAFIENERSKNGNN